jgi:hypothetical protein
VEEASQALAADREMEAEALVEKIAALLRRDLPDLIPVGTTMPAGPIQ